MLQCDPRVVEVAAAGSRLEGVKMQYSDET
jgi:hypothetical protein